MQSYLPSPEQLVASNPGYFEEGVDDKEAARVLNNTPATLACWRSRGEGPPFVRIGRRVLYIRRDLYEWLARHRVRAA